MAANLTKRSKLLVTWGFSALLLGACGPAITPAAPSPSSVSATSSASSSAPPSGASTTTSQPPSSAVTTPVVPSSRADIPAASTCGTLTAASGLTLQVLGNSNNGIDCAEARRIIGEFHQKINGKQSADSAQATSDTVDGWLCVSGAPSSQGGTTCSKADKTLFAAVVPVE